MAAGALDLQVLFIQFEAGFAVIEFLLVNRDGVKGAAFMIAVAVDAALTIEEQPVKAALLRLLNPDFFMTIHALVVWHAMSGIVAFQAVGTLECLVRFNERP